MRYGALNSENETDMSTGERMEKLVLEDASRVRNLSDHKVSLREDYKLVTRKVRALRQKQEQT